MEEYYSDAATLDTATPIVVTVMQDTPNIDFSLDQLGSISGTVRDLQGNPLSGAQVGVFDANAHSYVRSVYTASDGSYRVEGLATGGYHVGAMRSGFVGEYYQDAATPDLAQLVSVALNQDTLINFNLAPST